ncbi:MAG: type II toxin-antitoxin system HipA family toxin [Candidatus Methanoplasma sp.]|jgi:serine/threonine-protein kinase HipA|nr:type II toxin-antitoxin system HipA family toxin [Candidatus Methanoplasma sp.]
MDKERVTRVILWGNTVGYATWNQKEQCAVFQYDPEFSKSGYDVAPLMMPLASRPYRFGSLSRETFRGLPGMLSDSLPDSYGNALIDKWIDKNNIRRSDFTPLDRLCYIGKRGIGALEYEPAVGKAYDGRIDVNKLSDLAASVLSDREEFRSDLTCEGLEELLSVGTSAGGARAKAVIGINEKGEVRSGQAGLPDGHSHWLIKFDTEPDRSGKIWFCRIEYAYHEMAKDCGIDMTECRLLEIGNKAHFITKRFDRIKNEKIHTQTLCALAHFDFRVPTGSYADLMNITRHLQMPYSDQEQVFRRMVFNAVMRNRDDHTKNFSFLMAKDGRWRLSPAYDMTYVFDPADRLAQQQLMSGPQDITRKDLIAFADRMNIGNAADIIDTIISVSAEWKRYARSSGVPERTADKIDAVLLRDI